MNSYIDYRTGWKGYKIKEGLQQGGGHAAVHIIEISTDGKHSSSCLPSPWVGL
jgi:hypothetical protein